MSGYIGATGLDENQEQFDILKDEIDANASYINNLVGIPDPLHTAVFGINVLNPGLFGLVERAEVKIKLLETAEEGLGTDLTGLQTEVSGIQTEVSGIQTEITGIQGQVLGIEGDISTLNGAVFLEGGAIALVEIQAASALTKANRALDIWDYSGDNVYHKKAGNVGIGTTFGSTLTNKLEVQGNINIPTGSTFRIGDEPFNYTHLAGEQPVSSKWTNATDVDTNIYYNSGNVGIGITTAINNKMEVGGNLNISTGSKYKINNVDLAFSDLAGSLSYNSLTNQLSGGTNIQILNGVINNTYELPKATTNAIGGVRPDGTTITINTSTGVISASAGTAQVNSDWTQTNTSLKSFIQNKPTAGTNISFANNTITNIITGSPTQNIIDLNDNYLIVKDKPDSQIVSQVDVPLTSGNEPIITSPAFTESIQTFTHSGGAENQTTHTFSVGRNTICDILIVGGGGAGGNSIGGGGGAGGVVYTINQTLIAGTYTIGVGKGGTGIILAGTEGQGTVGIDQDGKDSFVQLNSTDVYLSMGGVSQSLRGKGGGGGGVYYSAITGNGRNGGSGGGAAERESAIYNGGSATQGNTLWNGTSYVVGGSSGNGNLTSDGNYYAAGGGGAGNTLFNNSIYNGKTGVQINITGASQFYAAGGGGGVYNSNDLTRGLGGSGIGGNGRVWSGSQYTREASKGTDGTGSGGGGGSYFQDPDLPAGSGGSGIVIIRFKTIVGAAIPEGNPITHKTLNFAYYNDNLVAYYKFNGNYLDSNPSNTKYNLSAFGTPEFQTTRFIEGQSVLINADNEYLATAVDFPNQFGMTYSFWFLLDVITANRIVLGIGADFFIMLQPQNSKLYISNTFGGNETYSFPSFTFSSNTWYHLVLMFLSNGTWKLYMNGVDLNINGLGGTYPLTAAKLPTGKLFIAGKNIGYYTNTFHRGNVDEFYVFNKELSQAEITSLYNKTYQAPINQYTLSVQAGTSIQVNNGTAQYLSGNYTISVGATQSSVVVAGIGPVGSDPYPLQNGSTIAIRYSMLQRITSTINIKKDGLIKYVPASGTNPTTGSWNIIDIDTQPLTQFSGNLPANRLDNIDMSKVATGTLPLSRTTETLPISRITGNYEGTIPINLTSGNLPASRLDNIDMSKVATGSLDQSRVGNLYIPITNQFHRIVYAHENIVDTQGIWTNKFRINTNLHLNQYNQSYNYYQYFLSMSPNNVQDRHKYWFGTVKMSTIVGTDNPANTQYYNIISNSMTNFDIRGTSSTQGVWWLDIWVYTTAYCESLIAILH